MIVLCDAVGRDAHSGKWMLTGLFDTVLVPRFPATHASMDVFFRLWLSGHQPAGGPAERLEATLALRGPSGQESELAPFALAPGIHGLVEGSLRIHHLPLPEPGAYELRLLVAGEPVARTWLRAEALPDPASAVVQ